MRTHDKRPDEQATPAEVIEGTQLRANTNVEVPVQKQTSLDVFRFMLHLSLGPAASRAFQRDIMPKFKFSQEASRVLTEAEYQFAIEKIQPELPYFLRWLLNQRF